MCDCFRIGGPWIAEDPNCPIHGYEAQEKRKAAYTLREQIQNASSLDELKALLIQVVDLIDDL